MLEVGGALATDIGEAVDLVGADAMGKGLERGRRRLDVDDDARLANGDGLDLVPEVADVISEGVQRLIVVREDEVEGGEAGS
jgi:hypothetical protein